MQKLIVFKRYANRDGRVILTEGKLLRQRRQKLVVQWSMPE